MLFSEASKPYLHGELVGAGLLMQNYYNNETERNTELIRLMQKYSMPYRVSELGVEKTEESFIEYFERIKNSSAINGKDSRECEKLALALRYLWEIE